MRLNYDHSQIDQVYDAGRELPVETARVWMDTIRSYIPEQITRILDLGSGTGRFSPWLVEAFDADVIAVDPSEKMRQHAIAHNPLSERITILPGAGEAIPLDDASVDLVFLSMIYHHLPDVAATMHEIRRVLRAGGYLVIRNTTKENLPRIPMFTFFPTARVLDEQRMPGRQEMMQQAGSAGLHTLALTPVRQLFTASYQQYLAKLSTRSVSALELISDEEFTLGIERLTEYCREHGEEVVYEEQDLFIAKRMG